MKYRFLEREALNAEGIELLNFLNLLNNQTQ